VLKGGTGEDIFAFEDNFGDDIIRDFNTNDDVINFHPHVFSSFAEVEDNAEQVDDDVVITFEDNTLMI
jgi:hypothetical protein